jgi:hypothetical protein
VLARCRSPADPARAGGPTLLGDAVGAAQYGVRLANPPQMYPRVRNQGSRVDSWPEGGFPGSD